MRCVHRVIPRHMSSVVVTRHMFSVAVTCHMFLLAMTFWVPCSRARPWFLKICTRDDIVRVSPVVRAHMRSEPGRKRRPRGFKAINQRGRLAGRAGRALGAREGPRLVPPPPAARPCTAACDESPCGASGGEAPRRTNCPVHRDRQPPTRLALAPRGRLQGRSPLQPRRHRAQPVATPSHGGGRAPLPAPAGATSIRPSSRQSSAQTPPSGSTVCMHRTFVVTAAMCRDACRIVGRARQDARSCVDAHTIGDREQSASATQSAACSSARGAVSAPLPGRVTTRRR